VGGCGWVCGCVGVCVCVLCVCVVCCAYVYVCVRYRKKRKEGGAKKGAGEQALAPKELSHAAVTGRQLGRPARREPCIQLSGEGAGAD